MVSQRKSHTPSSKDMAYHIESARGGAVGLLRYRYNNMRNKFRTGRLPLVALWKLRRRSCHATPRRLYDCWKSRHGVTLVDKCPEYTSYGSFQYDASVDRSSNSRGREQSSQSWIVAGHRRLRLSQPVTDLESQLRNLVLFSIEFRSYTFSVSGHDQSRTSTLKQKQIQFSGFLQHIN